MRRPAIAVPLARAACLAAVPAGAAVFDEFEVFDGRVSEPGRPELNLHLNLGRRGRLEAGEGGPRNGALFTTEVGYGTAPWHQVALYLPVAREFSAVASSCATASSRRAPTAGPSPSASTSSCGTSPTASPRPIGARR
jgi:hypothetical protein